LIRVVALVLFALALAGAARADDCLDLGLYGSVLQANTKSVPELEGTRVDYAALRISPQWADVVKSLAMCDPAKLANREQKLAFWINAYNVLAIDLVARHWPVESIKDLGSFLFPVWGKTAGQIHGVGYTLDEIENRQLRPLGDPRIHAAIVCASRSCPSLAREPYSAEQIDAQLDAAFARFVADPRKGVAVKRFGETGTLRLSPIFKWFAEDFDKRGGALAIVTRYASGDERKALERPAKDWQIEYLDYDWGVNG
jgi:Protein of unknown function, DUF547